MDTSNGANRTLDFVIGRITDPEELGREEYAELFEYVSNLIYPDLSKMGMKPLNDVGGALSRKLFRAFEKANLQHVRLMLAQQHYLLKGSRNPSWEVYLTEKGHWVIVLSRRPENDVQIISNKDEFLEYYDRMYEDGYVHPWHWLLEAPRFVASRAATLMATRLQKMEFLEETLRHIGQRFFIANNGSSNTP